MWSVFFLLCNNSLQAEHKPFLLASFPRSGSTYLTKIIAESVNGKYVDAPWYVKQKYKDTFTMASGIFGSKYLKNFYENKEMLFKTPEKPIFENAYNQWIKTGFKGTKELSLYSYLPFYLEKFDVTLLYRHRRFSFPSAMPDLLLKIYNAFVEHPLEDATLEALRKFALAAPLTDVEKQCTAHMVAWYTMLKSSEKEQISIIEWKKLILLPESELENYLEDRFPESVGDAKKMARLIYDTRMGSFKDFWKKGYKPALKYVWRKYIRGVNPLLAEKEDKYYALNVEEYNQKLLAYIRKIDPDFTQWQFLA